ncbi:MAG: SusF/SusE family outer membrane protein [Bacteroidota bacterium]
MKNMSIFKILAFLMTMTIFIASCTKESSDVRLDPTLSTSQVIDVKSDSATVVGFVVAAGDGFTEKGVCYNTAAAPTIENNKVVYSGDINTATFNVILSGLDYATKYYVRAYATNASGTLYGEEFDFTTLPVIPTVSTAAITDITGISATGGGNITNNGGAEVTARGVCFGLTENPTILDGKTVDGLGLGEYVSAITGLAGSTTYHVRAYAINSAGVAYGADVSFTTLEIVITTRKWYVPGDYVADSYPGHTFANWDPANSPQVESLEATPDLLEGYVYMANPANQWKFATQANWDGPNYGDGGAGLLSETGENINSPAGYYKLNVNAAALSYTAIATAWGVIGSATPNGWDDETALTYDPLARAWKGGLHLTAAEFKFRANHDWGFNYGSNANDGKLQHDGSNIPVATEDDYYFTLDLSTPNTYTYTANRWGLIGSATPGGWDSDQNLSWDAVNQAMTITVDLIVGDIKFRANDDWAINLGGTTDLLTQDGANIAIAEAGNYTINLYLAGIMHFTIVKN